MDGELIEYDVSHLTREQRETLEFRLVVAQVPVQRSGGSIVVPVVHESEVDALLTSMEMPNATPARELAGPGRRIVGALIDGAVIGLPRMFAYTFLAESPTLIVLFVLIDALYTIGLTARFGRTVGKLIVDTEVVRIDGVAPPGWRVATIRYAVVIAGFPLEYFFGTLGVWLSFAWMIAVFVPIFGRQRRGIHDRIAGTDVVVRD